MKKSLRIVLPICLLVLANCDSNEPPEDNTFSGRYINAPGFIDAKLNINSPTDASSQFDYEASLEIFYSDSTELLQLECTGNETILNCNENPVMSTTNTYVFTKTSVGVNMNGAGEIKFLKES